MAATGQTLGRLYDPLGVHLHNPYPFYARARQQEPVFWSAAVNAWVLTRYQDVRWVLRSPEVFSSANVLRPRVPIPPATAAVLGAGALSDPDPPGLASSDGAAHRRLRAPVAHGLSPARVEAAEPFIRARAEALVDTFESDGRAELIGQYATPLARSVIANVCGLDPDDMPVVAAGSARGNQLRLGRLAADQQPAAAHAAVAYQQMCARQVHARRAAPSDDLIGEFVAAVAPGDQPLTPADETEVTRTVATVITAGHVTTSALIGSTVRHLLTHRKQWELVCQQPDLIANAVDETARFDPPTQALLRVTTQPVTLGGHHLPERSEVLATLAAANRDPAVCENPDVFDITRPPTRHVAFGAGPHACVGAALGRRETQIAVEVVARRLPRLRLVAGQALTIKGTLMLRSLTSLHLTW